MALTPPFLADLHAAMAGDLAGFTAGLAGPSDPRRGVRADALLDDTMVAAIIARFEARFGATDRRAIMSMWASIYFAAALPPLLAANILLGIEPDLGLDRVAFMVAPNFRIEALQVGETVRRLDHADPGARFDGLVFAHLAAFIDLVADRGGVTRRLLWSNAGNVFEAFIQRLERVVGVNQAAVDAARAFLAKPRWPGDDRNPLFEPVRTIEGQRIRRVCCIRYLIPAQSVCGACPLAAGNAARAAGRG